ncbi:MAG: GIY-YIG nuclease family protein [Deltaproteobacteria bacterium]|nr:GIY-YIG nuclease family protein [Deltaproteobacteria bacterium]
MWVYVLRSEKNIERIYVGLTEDVDRRLDEHNSGQSAATYKFRPWKCEVKVWFDNPTKAERFERYLKSGSGRAFSKRHF